MKRIISGVLVFSLILGLVGCKKSENTSSSIDSVPRQTSCVMMLQDILYATTEDALVSALGNQEVTDDVWDVMYDTLDVTVNSITDMYVSSDAHKYCIYVDTSNGNKTLFIEFDEDWEMILYDFR